MIPWYLYALAAVFFRTYFEILRKKALKKIHTIDFEALRSLFVALIGICMIPFIDFSFDKVALGWIYLASLLGSIAVFCYAKALKHTEISLISPLENIKPALVAILAALFLSESLRAHQIVGISIIFISAYLLESDYHFSNFFGPIKKLFKLRYCPYFLLAVFLISIGSVLDKFILSTFMLNIFTYFFFVWFFVAVNLNLFHILFYDIKRTKEGFRKVKKEALIIAGLSVVHNLFALKAISMAYASLVIPLLSLSNFFTVFVGGAFFHENHRYLRLTVSSIMLIGVYLIIL